MVRPLNAVIYLIFRTPLWMNMIVVEEIEAWE
jgi:hypothetical protein